MAKKEETKSIPWKLTLGALGVVYGDIGTSPLYAMRQCFSGTHSIAPSQENILGVLSLIFWALIIVISIKYLVFVVRADNQGQGGILALLTLTTPKKNKEDKRLRRLPIYLGLFGAALLYGDGIIAPAISVLSAVEGLKIATPVFEQYIIVITVAILFSLFYFQKSGTGKIGAVFGPVILVWFFTIGSLGVYEIINNPMVLQAVNPYYAFSFFSERGWQAFITLGAVFLVVTGGESLYTDMGHFGKSAMRYGWFFVVLPSLVLNYMGQGALLLRSPESILNPFYLLAPDWALLPLVFLATFATIIASQAVIAGAFSITNQAVQLGYLPRIPIVHTSDQASGQIYIPLVNWLLCFFTIFLVLEFKSSAALAAAYGIAVSSTMVITTLFLTLAARKVWHWNISYVLIILVLFFTIDLSFLCANLLKINEGGWAPLAFGSVILTIMTTWRTGRDLLFSRLSENLLPLNHFIKGLRENPPIRIAGTAIFMNRNNHKVPQALIQNVKHSKVLHEKNILLSVNIEDVPYVAQEERIRIEHLDYGFQRMAILYGFMEVPDVPAVLENIKGPDKVIDFTSVTFYLGKETLFASDKPGMALWREKLFAFMSRNAQPATNFFRIPKERVVEIGIQIEL